MNPVVRPKARNQSNYYNDQIPEPGLVRIEDADPRVLVQAARSGMAEARERIIEKYRPFIIKTAAAVSRRYLRPGEDDEISVALLGFNEAIDCYNLAGKVPFLSFAEIVIRRRLVDYYRAQASRQKELPLSVFTGEGDEEQRETPRLAVLLREAEAEQERICEAVERREEIGQLRRILAEYGLDFRSLVKCSPKHADTRKKLIAVSRAVAGDRVLVGTIARRKCLPIVEVAAMSGLSRKTIERHRRYILAVVLVVTHGLPHIQSFL